MRSKGTSWGGLHILLQTILLRIRRLRHLPFPHQVNSLLFLPLHPHPPPLLTLHRLTEVHKRSFLASNITLTRFLLMIILYWVAPIVAPFETSLDTLKILFTAWGAYTTLASFTIFPSCNFMFTEPFITHFVFWPFPTVTLISDFLTYVMSLFLYVMCDDAPMSPNHYSMSSSFFYSWNSPQNVDPMKRSLTSLLLSFLLFSRQSTALWPLFPQFSYSPLKRIFLQYYCCFCCHFYWFLPNSLTLCGHICHTCYIRPWRTCYSFFFIYFIRHSTLEPYLIHIFPVFFFCSTLSSVTNVYISSNI